MSSSEVYRIPPNHYVHILDENTNVLRLVTGPLTYICQDHETVKFGPSEMVIIPPRHYVIIKNPVVKEISESGTQQVAVDSNGAYKLSHGHSEVRLAQPPFPLYPGEELTKNVAELRMLLKNEAMELLCVDDFEDADGKQRHAGERWLFHGPGLYVPHPYVEERGKIRSRVIRENQALKLRARQDFEEKRGGEVIHRIAGSEWMVDTMGNYLVGINEEVVEVVNAINLTNTKAVHMRAKFDFTDQFGQSRTRGQEWLITNEQCSTYMPSVDETKIRDVPITILSTQEFTVICDPYDEEKQVNQLGMYKLVKGPCSFFLHPGERLRNNLERVYVLSPEEGLIIKANEEFEDEVVDVKTSSSSDLDRKVDDEKQDLTVTTTESGALIRKVHRQPGMTWMIRGPTSYVPPVYVTVIKQVRKLSLDKTEGVYVRNIKTGNVQSVVGENYLLTENEELYEKDVPESIERLLSNAGVLDLDKKEDFKEEMKRNTEKRDKTRVITYQVPHNSAVQIYDYEGGKSRVVFGPDLVKLEPNEMFTPLSLSAGKPKRPNRIRSLHLKLGPDFSTDHVIVETSDHARLKMVLSYNWYFDLSEFKSEEENLKIFSVKDFVGDLCNKMASRVRGAVAQVTFDNFHKNSNDIVMKAVFGVDKDTKEVRSSFKNRSIGLVVSGIDIKEIEPVEQKTKTALQRAVQLAIEITTKSQEADAHNTADKMHQQAMGQLEKATIADEAKSEEQKGAFYVVEAETKAVESSGNTVADAESRAESMKIMANARVACEELVQKALKIMHDAEMESLEKKREEELTFLEDKKKLEAEFEEEAGKLQVKKFEAKIKSIGVGVVQNLATSKESHQVSLLKQLNLESTLVMDGKKPINFFDTANRMISKAQNEEKEEDDDDDDDE